MRRMRNELRNDELMSDSKYYRTKPGSEAEKDCREFFEAMKRGRAAILELLNEVGAVALYDDGLFMFKAGVEPGMEFSKAGIESGGRIPYRINRRKSAGKALHVRLDAAKALFPDRFCFHLDYAGVPLRPGSFTCAYPAQIGESFYIVVPLDGWDGETKAPAESTELRASEWFRLLEEAEERKEKAS